MKGFNECIFTVEQELNWDGCVYNNMVGIWFQLKKMSFIPLFLFLINSIGGVKPSCQREFRKTTSCWDKTCAGEKATTPCPMLFFRTNGKFLSFNCWIKFSLVISMNVACIPCIKSLHVIIIILHEFCNQKFEVGLWR